MKSKEAAYAQGEKIKEVLLELLMRYQLTLRKLDGTEFREQQAASIAAILKIVQEQLKPAYKGKVTILNDTGRRLRSFEFEYKRLWDTALALYVEERQTSIPEIELLLKDPANAQMFDEFRRGAIEQVQTLVLPLIEQQETPGDDFYLYILECMARTDPGVAINIIADTRKTPAETMPAIYGMFGLLKQAREAERRNEMCLAYSFLLDANRLIGMYEGAKYAAMYYPKAAAKRQAKLNSAKSRKPKEKIKSRARELFYSLRPADKDGRRSAWPSAAVAMERIWDALVEEAHMQGHRKLGITEKPILTLCQDLFKRDAEGGSLDIQVHVVQRLPDGTDIKVPCG